MPTSRTLDQHLAVVRQSGTNLLAHALAAGLDAPVPTCPAWDARALLAHQAMVHRWATANIVGDDPNEVPTQTALRDHDDLPGYYADGLDAVIGALRAAPADLKAMTFLNDAPAPREFWARRQAHETAIHMVDAAAAASAPVSIDRDVAVDGIDELLRGFFTRGKSKLFDGTVYTIAVEPTSSDRRWVARVDERMTMVGDDDDADVTIRGTSAGIYLGLWNRGDDVDVTGRTEFLARWRETQRVRWS